MAPSFPKKITHGNMGLTSETLNKIAEKAEGKGTIPVMRVVGRVNGIETGTSTFGDWIKFVGQHFAVNLVDGKEAKSRKLMLPDAGTDLLDSELNAVKKKDPDGTLEYGIEVGIDFKKPRKAGDNCYMFSVASLMESKGEDPLRKIMDSLPKPKKVPQLG